MFRRSKSAQSEMGWVRNARQYRFWERTFMRSGRRSHLELAYFYGSRCGLPAPGPTGPKIPLKRA